MENLDILQGVASLINNNLILEETFEIYFNDDDYNKHSDNGNAFIITIQTPVIETLNRNFDMKVKIINVIFYTKTKTSNVYLNEVSEKLDSLFNRAFKTENDIINVIDKKMNVLKDVVGAYLSFDITTNIYKQVQGEGTQIATEVVGDLDVVQTLEINMNGVD